MNRPAGVDVNLPFQEMGLRGFLATLAREARCQSLARSKEAGGGQGLIPFPPIALSPCLCQPGALASVSNRAANSKCDVALLFRQPPGRRVSSSSHFRCGGRRRSPVACGGSTPGRTGSWRGCHSYQLQGRRSRSLLDWSSPGGPSRSRCRNTSSEKESVAADVFQVVQDELFLDGNAQQNLATFCQTWEEPEVHRSWTSPSTRTWSTRTSIPRRPNSRRAASTCSPTFGTAPHAADTLGTSAVGSSEACMLGGMALLKWR